MSVHDMLQWWNLIYALPLALSVVWILMTVLSGAHGHGHAHGYTHVSGHGGHGLAHGLSHTIDHNMGHAVTHAVGGARVHGSAGASHAGHTHASRHSHNSGRGGSSASKLMAVLGVDEAPVSLIIGLLFLCWGAFGLLSNRFFGVLKIPSAYIWPSMAVAFITSTVITRTLAEVVGKLMPKDETYGVSLMELVGSMARTVFITSEKAGTVDIKDAYGTVHRCQAKVEQGRESIPSGADVIVIDYDDADKRFVVRKSDI